MNLLDDRTLLPENVHLYTSSMRLLHLFLAVQLLVSSAGFTLYVHECKFRGWKVQFTPIERSCCQNRATTAVAPLPGCWIQRPNPKSCCQESAQLIKTLVVGSAATAVKVLDGDLAGTLAPNWVFPAVASSRPVLNSKKIRQQQAYAPPPLLVSTCSRLQVFRI